ncbi:MAG: hypothetical protein ACOYKR_13280 [Sphingobacterium thalpophilum]
MQISSIILTKPARHPNFKDYSSSSSLVDANTGASFLKIAAKISDIIN